MYYTPERLFNIYFTSNLNFLKTQLEKDKPNLQYLFDCYSQILWCVKKVISIKSEEVKHENNSCECLTWLTTNGYNWIVCARETILSLTGKTIQKDPDQCWLISTQKSFFLLKLLTDITSEAEDFKEEITELENSLKKQNIDKKDIAYSYHFILDLLEQLLQEKCPTLDHRYPCCCEKLLQSHELFTDILKLEINVSIKLIGKNNHEIYPKKVCWLLFIKEKYSKICKEYDMETWLKIYNGNQSY